MISFLGRMRRSWVVLTVVVTVLVAAVVVSRLRGNFGSDLPEPAAGAGADAIVAFNHKTVTYELSGPRGSSGAVSYLDVDGRTQEARFTDLPWSVTITTTNPGVFANVVAQSDSSILSCRIRVNGIVTTERHAAGPEAQAFCLNKVA